MLKHNDIISVLSLAQKVRMLTGAGNLSGKDMKILGIPQIKAGDMKDYGRGLYPNVTALANAWDTELWHRVAKEKTEKIIADGKNFVITPGPKVKLSPYRREISEDTFLAASISRAHTKAAMEKGIASALSGFYLTRSDVDALDVMPNERTVNEFVNLPYKNAFLPSALKAVMTDTRDIGKNYAQIPRLMQDGISKYADFMICAKATDENTVDFVSRGIICLEGSDVALQSAITRYKKLKNSIEINDGTTAEQLEEEVREGSAISMETVDLALDKLIDFIYTVNKSVEPADSEEQTHQNSAFKATLDSIVLLKNSDYSLPLDEENRIAIIGDMAFRDIGGTTIEKTLGEELKCRGYRYVGSERGYDMDTPQSNNLTDSALILSGKCDTVLLFLGFGYEAEKRVPKTETLSLPANQLSLAHKLMLKGRRVIGVISSGHAPDIEFTRDFDAVIFAPLEVEHSAAALAQILSGEQSPSGKLAYTLYAGSDGAFGKGRAYREKYGMKVGSFIGYRYYDTAKLTLGYPFGHGLSYVDFRYSGLEVEKNRVRFTVENRGKMPASEVAQLYIGPEKSSVIRPEKELCGFAKIRLMPGEKRTVSIHFSVPAVYSNGNFAVENGSYSVSVGSSVSDIRLKSFMTVSGDNLKKEKGRLSDYLQSVSNVKEDNYTLEANYSFMKTSIKNILLGIAFIVLAISAAIFNSVTDHPSMFVGGLSAVLAVISIIFFVCEAAERNRAYDAERKEIDSANKKLFSDAEEIPVLSTAKMFRDEFEHEEEETKEAVREVYDEYDESSIQGYIKKDFFFADAVSEFKSFFEKRGYKLGMTVAENLLSSVASSRLIMTSGMDSEQFSGFIRVFSEYFGSDAFIDRASKKAMGDNSFYSYDYHGDHTRKNILLALDSAKDIPSKIVVAALDGANAMDIDEYLTPFMKYLYSPKKNNKISLQNDKKAPVSYNIGSNLRFFINLNADVSLDTLPSHVVSLAALNRIEYIKCQPDENFVGVRELNHYQLEYMSEKESVKADISEDVWKRVDKLERYAARFSDYRIGNKLWLGFEKHIGMLIAAKLDINEALDTALASRLISSVAVAIKDKIGEEDQNLLESIEFIFGEERVDVSKNFINTMIFAEAPQAAVAVEEEKIEKSEEASVATEIEAAEEAVTESVAVAEENVPSENDAEEPTESEQNSTEESILSETADNEENVSETEENAAEQSEEQSSESVQE